MLALGGVVPLLVVGLAVLWAVWSGKQHQLNEAIEQQAELAAVVFDHWLDAQYQPLKTIASYPQAHLSDAASLEADLKATMINRGNWIDLHVVDRQGNNVATYPSNAEQLSTGLMDKLVGETRRGLTDVETDWTRGEGHYILALAFPVSGGGAVIARIDGKAVNEPLQGMTLPDRALVTLLDQRRRIIYRSQTPESTLGLDLSNAGILSVLDQQNTGVAVQTSAVDDIERVYGLARVGKTGYVVMVGVPSSVLYASAWRQLTGYALVGMLIVFCTMTGALLIARSIARPVGLLSFTAEQFGKGNFSARAPSEGQDEVSRLGANFNAMAARLEKREARLTELDRLKSEFVSNVSHELRTPLTTIKALTRLLMRDGLDETKRREYVDTISVECDRQIDLVLNLLDLSRIEGGVLRIKHERVDVSGLIESVVRSQMRSAEKRNHDLRVERTGEVAAACADSKALRRVLSNIVENAIKYTPDNGRITVSASEHENHVAINVTDNGRGIPAEDMPVLFDKFHRGRPAHSEAISKATTGVEFLEDADVSGVGLGLYLSKNIMAQMGGQISVESEVGRGSTFTLHLLVWHDGACTSSRGKESCDGQTVAGC